MEVPGIEPMTSWLVVRHADPRQMRQSENHKGIKRGMWNGIR